MNNQQPWNTGMMMNYSYQVPAWNQAVPTQQPQTLFYPQPTTPAPTANPNAGSVNSPASPNSFPATGSSFSPFLGANAPSNPNLVLPTPVTNIPQQPSMPTPSIAPRGSNLVFPDGSQF